MTTLTIEVPPEFVELRERDRAEPSGCSMASFRISVICQEPMAVTIARMRGHNTNDADIIFRVTCRRAAGSDVVKRPPRGMG